METLAPGSSVRTSVDCPRGSGLGGSSALAVALVRLLLKQRGKPAERERVFRLCRDLEAAEIRTPTGDQDYLAALYGGLNVIEFGPAGPRVEPVRDVAGELLSRIVLIYTGEPHFSGINNWAVFRSVFDGDRSVRRRLADIGRVAADVADCLRRKDLDAVGRLVGQEWRLRKGLAADITTEAIDAAFRIGKRHGALAGKVCGAGGGGCALLYGESGTAPRIQTALEQAGFRILPTKRAGRGVHAF